MPIVRLEFELDSEVYPELHAALTSMRSARARAERLRQLAASGLVWEKVRIHGAAAAAFVVEDQPAPPVRAGASPPQRVPEPAEEEPLPQIERRAASGKRMRPAPSPRRRASDFVDLALNAEPTLVPEPLEEPLPERRATTPSRREVEQAIRELPVLMDVVAEPVLDAAPEIRPDVRPLDESLDDEPLRQRELPEPAPWASMSAYPDDLPPMAGEQVPAEPSAAPAEEAAEDALHVTALSHKPATRSRLMKMKERGLFKNG